MAVKLKVKSDPVVKDGMFISPGRTSLDNTADVRDILSGLVGKGYTTMGDQTIKSNYNRLQALLGPAQAHKLMTHMFIFNSRPDMKNAPIETRIKQFYDSPSADPDVNGALGKIKTFGYGVLPGFRDSNNQLNQELAGRVPTEVAAVDPKQAQAVKLKIAGKL